jgi:2-amino-4-hydroxy-6-hydroxymethyldihydropteridine diphosphokinase
MVQMGLPAYFGLGSNLGDRLGYLTRACEMMYNAPGLARHAVSRVYETEPWGLADQPAFLNCVVRAFTDLDPNGLLALARQIESALGRSRLVEDVRWGPRTIDVDILMVGDLMVNRPDLTIPHPRMWQRSFVLVPMLDLEPDMRAPDGRSLYTFVQDLPDRGGVRRIRADLQGVFGGAENRLDQ